MSAKVHTPKSRAVEALIKRINVKLAPLNRRVRTITGKLNIHCFGKYVVALDTPELIVLQYNANLFDLAAELKVTNPTAIPQGYAEIVVV